MIEALSDGDLISRRDEASALVAQGAVGLLSFHDVQSGGFFRDNLSQESPGARLLVGQTSTHRAVVALVEAARVLAEEDVERWSLPSDVNALELVTAALHTTGRKYYWPGLHRYLEPGAHEWSHGPDLVRSDANGSNSFTKAHLAVALAFNGSSHFGIGTGEDNGAGLDLGTRALAQAEAELRTDLEASGFIGRLADKDPGHDFLTLWIVRACDAAVAVRDRTTPQAPPTGSWPVALVERVLGDLVRQLGWHAAGVSGRFDPGELAFSLALLEVLAPDEAQALVARCLDIIEATQTEDGAWATSKPISPGRHRLLHVASYEVALAVSIWLESRVARGDHTHTDRVLRLLARTVKLARSSFTSVVHPDAADGVFRGWSNDRTRGSGLVESWATAVTVSFLVRYHDLVNSRLQARLIARYGATPRRRSGVLGRRRSWADLDRVLPRGQADRTEAARQRLASRLSDPTPDGDLAERLTSTFLGPVLQSDIARPAPSAVSFLLPGPPGSRKTTLVEQLAAALGWPLITISPPTFLVRGLDGVLAQATDVFDDLNRLRRAVVFFDECEDFFGSRPGAKDPKSPPVYGNFVTAGMLPKLQALHDQHWVIFVLATNASLEQLDQAVVRSGRFEGQVEMGYPGAEPALRYLAARTGRAVGGTIEAAVRLYASSRLADGDLDDLASGVPWSALDALLPHLGVDAAPVATDALVALMKAVGGASPHVIASSVPVPRAAPGSEQTG